MTLRVLKHGPQTTIQAAPRIGLRHLGVPASGAADPLSMALANRLVDNAALVPALEVALGGFTFETEAEIGMAICGGIADCEQNHRSVPQHEAVNLLAGDRVTIGPVTRGGRVYIAFAGGLCALTALDSQSTYLPAGLGGHHGRALRRDDKVPFLCPQHVTAGLTTPEQFRPPMLDKWAMRASRSAESDSLAEPDRFFDTRFSIGAQSDRVGVQLNCDPLEVRSNGQMKSASVFPGTVQCPEGGLPYLLSVDAQTTGGYPRIASVTRADRHLLGQLRAGDTLRFIERESHRAAHELKEKHEYWREWLPDIESVI